MDTRSAIQKFLDSAQVIEYSRPDVVASTVSRSGRVITQTRNTVKPWSFKITPIPTMLWTTYRQDIEELFLKDKHTEHLIKLGGNAGSAWLSEYQASAPTNGSGVLNNITVNSIAGNSLVINVSAVAADTVIFKAGDLLQFAGTGSDGKAYRYPYAVSTAVTKLTGETTKTITLNRGYIPQTNYNPVSATTAQNTIRVGNACDWQVIVTTLPAIRMLPGRLVEFASDLTLLEMVL